MNEANRELVAYCGLYCGDCFSYQGKIADLSRDLRKELRQARFDRVAEGMPFKEFRNYRECYEVLGALLRLRCKNACRSGGGNPWCKIRLCCRKKVFDGCWQCDEIESCNKLKFLEATHKDAHLKNLSKIRKVGATEWLAGKRYW